MPWKRESVMDHKVRMVGDWLSGFYGKSDLSRRYGVSRPTVDKWLTRYDAAAVAGLEERSRAPHSVANQTPEVVREGLIASKLAHPSWGPKKLVHFLSVSHPDMTWPAPSTAGEILKRAGLVRPRKTVRRTPPGRTPLTHCQAPNQVWSVDYKGDFRTGDGRRCYPLTISDNDSRYLLLCQGLRHPRFAETRGFLEWTFREYGLPDAIRSDNGAPFASRALGGLSALSVWWIRLGIEPERIEPGRPDQNGRHERMHRTLKAAVCTPPAATLQTQQDAFNSFCREYNDQRPHEALAMATPASCYRTSSRPWPHRLPEIDYANQCHVRRVRSSGEIKWKGKRIYVSEALIGEPVALTQDEDEVWQLWYSSYHIGTLNPGAGKFSDPKV
jgi:transposase InsO family protein/transposase-like protein